MDVDKVRLYILQQIESDAPTKNVKDSIKKDFTLRITIEKVLKKYLHHFLNRNLALKRVLKINSML